MTFVSRAGEKLAKALEIFAVEVKDLVCVDLGASTGGFTDCLLQAGAQRVYSVEKGYGTVDWKLRNDPRVVVMERTNALEVILPEPIDLAVIDCGWTRQSLILPKALSLLKEKGTVISLLKPHYEAMRQELKKGKVPEEFLQPIVDRVLGELKEKGIIIEKIIESPIVGEKGKNKEYLMLIRK
jgi:23S rRNA (cytidine1920-2'-O)/16S rRNA (cytidine1409-2'-O)-methyltransferase